MINRLINNRFRETLKRNPYIIHKLFYEIKYNGVTHLIKRFLSLVIYSGKNKGHQPTDKLIKPYTEKTLLKKIRKHPNHLMFTIVIRRHESSTEKDIDKSIKSINNNLFPDSKIIVINTSIAKTNKNISEITSPHSNLFTVNSKKELEEEIGSIKFQQGYFSVIDAGDEFAGHSFYNISMTQPHTCLIYGDEEIIEKETKVKKYFFKPEFSPEYLLAYNYINKAVFLNNSCIDEYQKNVLQWINLGNPYCLLLNLSTKHQIISRNASVLLSSSKPAGTDSKNKLTYEKKCLNDYLPGKWRITEEDIENQHRHITYDIKQKPLISIIIPFKDEPDLLEKAVVSLKNVNQYKNIEIIGINNNSSSEQTFKIVEKLSTAYSNFKVYDYNKPFNYSQINNHAVYNFARGKHILLMNNDIEIIEPQSIEAMLQYSEGDEIGVVGALLLYPDNTVQHAGVFIGIGNAAGHLHKNWDSQSPGYMNRLTVVNNVSAVTGALLMVKTSLFKELKGLNETNLPIAFNDIDFSLRAMEKGYRNIFTPHAKAYHYESKTRGIDNTPYKMKRYYREAAYFRKRHKVLLKEGDPYYSPGLTLQREDMSFR